MKRFNLTLQGKSTFRLIISEISTIGVNVVPLALWFFEDYAFETVVMLYAIESAVAIILTVLCVLLLAPAKEKNSSNKIIVRSRMIKDFLLISGFGMFVIYVFVGTFIFLLGKGKGVEFSAIGFGLSCIAAFQLFEFFSNLYLLRPLSLEKSESLLSSSFGAIALLIISILIGVFLGAFFDASIFLPFIVLKTIIDIGAPIQFFMGKSDAPQPLVAKWNVRNRNRF